MDNDVMPNEVVLGAYERATMPESIRVRTFMYALLIE
jgi:hypothetical protein